MSKFALCIGINKYTNPAICSLKVCEKDAEDVSNELNEDRFSFKEVKLLSTNNISVYPSKYNILSYIENLSNKALSEDIIFLYFSGHGFSSGVNQYLIPADAQYNKPESFINIAEVKDLINKSVARQKLIIIDACESGEEISRLKKVGNSFNPDSVKAIFKDVKGVYMLFSSSKDEVSWEDTDGQHSVFTKFLLKALKGEIKRRSSSCFKRWFDVNCRVIICIFIKRNSKIFKNRMPFNNDTCFLCSFHW